MKQERWERIKDLFSRALERPDEEREEFLARECASDPGLRDQVEKLLQSQGDAPGFLEPPSEEEIRRPLRLLSFDYRGCRLGEFEILERIGRGATGVVCLAKQTSLGRRVAIKILAPHLCQSAEKLERFRKEALAASRLRHRNVVSIFTVGEQEGAHYIAMEYVEGRSLRELLDQARDGGEGEARGAESFRIRDPKVAARTVREIANALHHCHEANVIHRDIKPQNILIDASGEPHIIDFGLARDLTEEGMTDTGVVLGTPQYMSPEQVLALGDRVDFRTDIYSLGALLYELLTLEPLYGGSAPAEVARKILHESPTPVRELNPHAPRVLAGICMKALRKSPDQRYPTAGAMAKDLDRYLRGEPVLVPRPSLVRELYHAVFHERPWIVAGAAVCCAALVIFTSPRANPVAAAPDGGSQVVGQDADQRPSSEPEEVRKDRKRLSDGWRRIGVLEESFPHEPIHSK